MLDLQADQLTVGGSQPLAGDELRLIDAYWRAANYPVRCQVSGERGKPDLY